MTISRTARVWVDEVRKNKTTHDTAEYFKDIFTKDEFMEFVEELIEQTKKCVDKEFHRLNLDASSTVMEHLYSWMDEHINYFDTVGNIVNTLYTEVFQTVSGFFGTGCTDSEFEFVRDAMGDFSWGEQMDFYHYLLTEDKPKVSHWIDEAKQIEERIGFSLPALKAEAKVDNIKTKIASTELLSATIKQNGANLIYAIMNTSEYDGGMGITIVEGMSPRILEDYGFDEKEINTIAKMGIGESFGDTSYGYGVVVVRMA